MASSKIRLRVGETITEDAARLERLAHAFESSPTLRRFIDPGSMHELLRVLYRAAALCHDEDRPQRG